VHQNLRVVVLLVKKLFNVIVAHRRFGGIHYDSALTKDAVCTSEKLGSHLSDDHNMTSTDLNTKTLTLI
jgi:hypothetical protein